MSKKVLIVYNAETGQDVSIPVSPSLYTGTFRDSGDEVIGKIVAVPEVSDMPSTATMARSIILDTARILWRQGYEYDAKRLLRDFTCGYDSDFDLDKAEALLRDLVGESGC